MTSNPSYPPEFEGLPQPESYIDELNPFVLYRWKGEHFTGSWLVEFERQGGAVVYEHDNHKCVYAGINDPVQFAKMVRKGYEDEER